MSWIELNLDTNNEAVDWVCTLLAKEIAPEDIQISEYQDSNHKWTFTVQIYLPEDAQIHQRIEAIAKILTPLHRTGMTSQLQTFIIEQKPNQIEASQSPANSLVRRIGDRFVILSPKSNYEAIDPQEIILHLQNSLAFGSGLHPATILSLRLLERHVTPSIHALDLGSGSGILSVALAKLGATVLAIDNDPIAVNATEEAVQRNQVTQKVKTIYASLGSACQLGHWLGSDILEDIPTIPANGQFDLIVANIFARIHISLANEFYKALRSTPTHTGILITSGYTSEREEDITSAMIAAGFSINDHEQIDEWIAIGYLIS